LIAFWILEEGKIRTANACRRETGARTHVSGCGGPSIYLLRAIKTKKEFTMTLYIRSVSVLASESEFGRRIKVERAVQGKEQ